MKYLMLLTLFVLVACDEGKTPANIEYERKALAECQDSCKKLGLEVYDVHSFGVGCTCKGK